MRSYTARGVCGKRKESDRKCIDTMERHSMQHDSFSATKAYIEAPRVPLHIVLTY